MKELIEKLKFIKLPIDEQTGKEQKEFEEMLGHIYSAYYSEFGKGYVIVGTNTKEASKAFDNTVYKTLIAVGEDKEFAKACAYEGEDSGMCLYIPKECFEGVNMKDIKLKMIIILVIILWAVMLLITGIKIINWQNEYNNKDKQIKLLEQSLNEQLQEKEVYMRMLESEEK